MAEQKRVIGEIRMSDLTGKCRMASRCSYSINNVSCGVEEKALEECPYLQVIGGNTKLVIEAMNAKENNSILTEKNIVIREENLRLKLALIGFIEQFYGWQISPEEADNYGIEYYKGEEKVDCFFHTFESAGEKAWRMLGLDKPIVGERELYKLEDSLRDELLKLKYKKEE